MTDVSDGLSTDLSHILEESKVSARIYKDKIPAANGATDVQVLHGGEEYELIKGCIREDAKCQRMLFDRYAGKMMGVCLRYANDSMEAEDMLQDLGATERVALAAQQEPEELVLAWRQVNPFLHPRTFIQRSKSFNQLN